MSVHKKKFCPFGSAVSLAIENIYTNVLFYYTEDGYREHIYECHVLLYRRRLQGTYIRIFCYILQQTAIGNIYTNVLFYYIEDGYGEHIYTNILFYYIEDGYREHIYEYLVLLYRRQL